MKIKTPTMSKDREIEEILKENYPTGLYAKLARTGDYVNTTSTVLYIFYQELQKAREEEREKWQYALKIRNAVVREYKDEGAMFLMKVENGKTYEVSIPIPKWAEVGKLQPRDESELDQPTASDKRDEEAHAERCEGRY